MRMSALVIAACLVAPVVSAQPIHGHPQKAAYASPAEWLTPSSQCHWRPGSGMPPTFPVVPVGLSVADPQIAHTHLDCTMPIYGEITGPIPVACVIKAFHTAGVVGGLISPLEQIRDVVYADTGTATAPVMRGDPMGVKQWAVSFVFDPALLRHTFPPTLTVPPHGWFTTDFSIKTFYDNGDTMNLDAIRPLYSMLTPSAPEQKIPDIGLTLMTGCSPNTLRRPDLNQYGNQMGEIVSEFVGLVPLAPIAAPWSTAGFFYAYATLEGVTGFQFPDGTFSLRRDVDIHNGIPGVDIMAPLHFQGNSQFQPTPLVLDPALIGSGTHNLVAFWQEPDGQGNDATALIVVNVTVGPGVPPPPPPVTVAVPNVVGLLQSAAAAALSAAHLTTGAVTLTGNTTAPAGTVVSEAPVAGAQAVTGSAVALTVSSAVPPPVWVTLSGIFQQSGTSFQFCVTPTACTLFVVKP